MRRRRLRSDPKASTKSKSMTSAQTTRRRTVFGEPPLLQGEDRAAFDELYDRVWAAVKPANILDEMFIFEVVCLEWEALRWGRLKLSLMRAHAFNALVGFLREKLDYEFYSETFADDLAQILQDNLLEDQADSARTLAYECARNEKDAVDTVRTVLAGAGRRLDTVVEIAQLHRAKELVQDYFRGEPDAATLIHKILSKAGKSMDAFMADALAEKLDFVERIDRLATIAESRRNASLRELDRRRALLGDTLRRTVQQIEHDELEVIETTPAKGKKAA